MICDLRREGEVYADGELIWKNGQFLAEPALEVVESGHGHELPSDERQQARTAGRRPRRLLHQGPRGRSRLRRHRPGGRPTRRSLWRRVLEAAGTRIFGSTLTAPRAPPPGGDGRAGELGEPAAPGRGGAGRRAHRHLRGRQHTGEQRRRSRAPGAPERRTTRSGASTSRASARATSATWSRSIRRRRRRRTPTCHSPSTRTSSSAPASSTTTTRAGEWEALGRAYGRPSPMARTKRRARIVGDGTDLTLGVEGRTWVPSDGRENFPDGEVFTGPIETRSTARSASRTRRATRAAASAA